MDDIKKFLDKLECRILFFIKKDGDRRFVGFQTPSRELIPQAPATYTEFDIGPTGLDIMSNNEPQGFIELPPYVLKAFVMAIVVATCDRYDYDIKLVKFELDGQEVDDIEFTKHMLNFTLDEENEKKDYLLREVTSNAATCPIKFHPDFQTRAVDLGIDDGYKRVKHILLGGNIYE